MKPLRSTARGEVTAEVCLMNVTMLCLMLKHSIGVRHEKGLTEGEVLCGYL